METCEAKLLVSLRKHTESLTPVRVAITVIVAHKVRGPVFRILCHAERCVHGPKEGFSPLQSHGSPSRRALRGAGTSASSPAMSSTSLMESAVRLGGSRLIRSCAAWSGSCKAGVMPGKEGWVPLCLPYCPSRRQIGAENELW